MTEAEWRACEDPAPMLDLLRAVQPSERKLRLFACDCCRRLGHLMSDAERAVVTALERWAEGEIPHAKIFEAAGVSGSPSGCSWGGTPARRVIAEATALSAWAGATRARAYTVDAVRTTEGGAGRVREWTRQSATIRCIFGNPFRAPALAPEWLTGTVLALAREVYESGDFSIVPVLGDALEDAGCASTEVLAHCRSGNAHGRGCWVVDLILGRG